MDMKEQDPPLEQPDGAEIRRSRSRFSRVARRSVLVLVGSFLLLNGIIQIPVVQNWLVGLITQSLSDRLETEVSIDYIRLAFFDKLQLDGLYLEGVYGDTLLYSDALRADLNLNPVVLLSRGLEVEAISIHTARFHINRPANGQQTNLTYALERLFPPREKPRQPFRLNLRLVELHDVEFLERDSVGGKSSYVYVPEAEAYLRQLDLPGKLIDVASLRLVAPRIELENRPQDSIYLASIDSATVLEPTDTAPSDSSSLTIRIGRFSLEDGAFKLDNYRGFQPERSPDQLNFKHLDLQSIQIAIDSFEMRRDTFTGRLEQIALKASSGFELTKLAVANAEISPQGMALNGLEIITPRSRIGDTLRFRYREWQDWAAFNDRVLMDARLNNAQVLLEDIIAFAPALNQNRFFNLNRAKVVQLDGRLRGRINNLRGQDIRLELSDGSLLEGNFSTRNLTLKNEEVVNLELDRLHTRIRTLRQLIPGFNPSPNFDRLGQLDFRGRFDGFFQDFVAFGDLRTDIGRAQLDMRMNLKPGQRSATYSGALSVDDFDLGIWTNNPTFGSVSFRSSVQNGVGLVAETASADVSGIIDQFTFRDYTYQNAEIEGRLINRYFNGDFAIQDENIDFSFTGAVDFRDSIPLFDFQAEVERLDMQALNLSKADLVFGGDLRLNLQNTQVSDLVGDLSINNLQILKDSVDRYQIDSIFVNAEQEPSGRKVLSLKSDVATGMVEGSYDFDELPGSIQQFIVRNYPAFAQRLNIKAPQRVLNENRFNFNFHIADSKGLNYLLSPQLEPLKGIDVFGGYDGTTDSLAVTLDVPRFEFGTLTLVDLALNLQAEQSEGDLEFRIDSTGLNQKTWFPDFNFISRLEGDTVDFSIIYPKRTGYIDTLDHLEMDGRFYPVDSTNYQVRLDRLDLQVLNESWNIETGNTITFGKQYIDVRDVILRSGSRSVVLEKMGERGLDLQMRRFRFELIDQLWDYPNLDFSGLFDARITVRDVFQLEGLRAMVESDTLLINTDDFGALRLDLETENIKDKPLLGYLSITRDTAQLLAELSYNLNDLQRVEDPENLEESLRRNYVDLGLNIVGYPLSFGNYWIGETVSDVVGSWDANIKIRGLFPEPRINGIIRTNGGALTIDYLQTRYRFDPYSVIVNSNLFSLRSLALYDSEGNRSVVARGGVTHDHFRNLGLDVLLRANNFIALDLKKGENELFYGKAKGTGIIEFTGSFVRPNISVTSIVGAGTHIVIPVAGGAEASDLDFVEFLKEKPGRETIVQRSEKKRGSTGVSLEMNLNVTEDAVMELVFDEKAGDIIRGTGRGDIRILVPRDDNFQMFGDYTITNGDYLFTLYNVVNKDFKIRPGGRVSWNGDPFDARIQLAAEYQDLKAPVSNFIVEYLSEAPASVQAEANNATDVDLTLELEGQLLKPNISFDIDFPNLTGQLETFVENKRRLLQRDQNELNRQVFGLIVAGQFLPSDLTFGQPETVVFNTLSEFASNQLSLLLTGLFREVFGEDNVLSGVDLDVAYNQYRTFGDNSQQGALQGNEFEVTLQQNFANNRLKVQLGGNVFNNTVTGGAAVPGANASGVFVGNDLVIEYALNDFRTLKLRLYQRLQPDIGGSRLQIGTGLSWRKEFDSFSEFFKGIKKDTRQAARREGRVDQ